MNRAMDKPTFPALATLLLLLLTLSTGCASSMAQLDQRSSLLEGRVKELESANRHLQLRLDAYEASLTLVEDQVAAVSNVVRTGAPKRELEVVRVAPSKAREEVVYSSTVNTPALRVETLSANGSTFDQGEDDDFVEIVVSQDKLDRYFRSNGSSASSSSTDSRPSSSGKRSPLPDVVVGDRLPVAGSTASAVSSSATVANTDRYKEGLKYYRQEQFSQAIEMFRAYLDDNPPEDYIDNALYWLGECYYGLGEYAEAARHFHRIVQDYPTANKVPDALLKVGLTYQRLGKPDSAREVMYYLIQAYPGTDAARMAQERVDASSAS